MYDINFSATDDADWAQSLTLIDNTTNGPLEEAATASFALSVKDPNGCVVLTAFTSDGSIEQPDDNVIQWRFPAVQMAGLCPGTTYRHGITMTTVSGTIQIAVGDLALIDGGF